MVWARTWCRARSIPDEFYVFKPTFEAGHRAVLRRALGSKKIKMVYAAGGGRETTRNVPTPNADRERFCISDEEVLTLADYAIKVEKHYSAKAGKPRPMDMEWAKDGIDGQLYMVQARPETVVSQRRGNVLETYTLKGGGRGPGLRQIGRRENRDRAPCASSPISLIWPSSARARCWSPIRPRPTGSR